MKVLAVVGILLAALAGSAWADKPRDRTPKTAIRVTPLSQQYEPAHATVGARISATRTQPGRAGGDAEEAGHGEPRAAGSAGPGRSTGVAGPDARIEFPTLRRDSPFLRDSTPLGPNTFWYVDDAGHACPYAADTVGPCYRVVAPAANPDAPALDPVAIAASLAARIDLVPGQIATSPPARGLTGVAAWFWLSPPPGPQQLSLSLAGETVTVTAEPEVEWHFGDGTDGRGSGVPYRPGPPPRAAVTHTYETRCLPGDRGRNPHVLASCGNRGYRVEALVRWRVSYRASGPVDASGTLAPRTTATAVDYAVSEARGFLVERSASQ